MKKMIPAYNDLFIKYLLGSECNNEILLEFINAVLQEIGLDPIVSATIKNPFNISDVQGGKETIVDVKAVDNRGRLYDVEIQSNYQPYFINRSLNYWAKMYSSQQNRGSIYEDLKPVICINILNYVQIKGDNFFSTFLIKNKDTNDVLTDNLIINFIELPKLHKILPNNFLQKFAWFLKTEGTEDSMLKTMIDKESMIQRAHENYIHFTIDEKMRYAAEAREKFQMDQRSFQKWAESQLTEGLQKGIEQGIKTGISKGIDEGKQISQRDIVISMRSNGIDDLQINKLTNIPIDIISQIK